VEDTGIGIKEEEQSKLFKMFSKLDQEAAENRTIVNNQGVGLGLTISNNLAKFLCHNKYMDGIKLESRYGRGSRFSFLISKVIDPKFEKQAEAWDNLDNDLSVGEGDIHDIKIKEYKYMLSPHQRKPSALLHGGARIKKLADETKKLPPHLIKSSLNKELAGKNGHNGGGFILIVDDNPLNISVVEFFIEKHNYQTKAALCGQTAVDIVRNNNHISNPIKLILMDLQMPLMDGYQTTKALRNLMSDKTVPNIPIIALTANDSDNDRRMCQEVGMCDYLVKPLKESELLKIIKKYC